VTLENNLITKQIKQWKLIHVLPNALEPESSVSYVVTRFSTDIRFTRLLSPICTLLISTYSLCRFPKFHMNGLLVSLRSSRHGYAPRSIGSDKLETFMLMSSEKDILDFITIDDLIHELVKDSQFSAKMLLL